MKRAASKSSGTQDDPKEPSEKPIVASSVPLSEDVGRDVKKPKVPEKIASPSSEPEKKATDDQSGKSNEASEEDEDGMNKRPKIFTLYFVIWNQQFIVRVCFFFFFTPRRGRGRRRVVLLR